MREEQTYLCREWQLIEKKTILKSAEALSGSFHIQQIAYIKYDKLGINKFYNKASAIDRAQDMNPNQLKLKVNDIYEKDEELTTKFEPSIVEDVINKAYLDTKLSNIKGQLSLLEKDYNEFNMHNDKQSEEILFERAVKTPNQILFDK